MEIHEINEPLFCKWMSGKGRFGRMGVQGDGSCFFHSVCALKNYKDYLFLSASKQKEVAYDFRCEFAKNFSEAEYKRFSKQSSSPKSYRQEKDGFCSPKVWADEVMIRHASQVLDINLIFLDISKNAAYCGVHGESTLMELKAGSSEFKQDMGIIAWVNKSHFEPIVRIDDEKTGLITTLFHHKEDKEFIKHVMSIYERGCKL
jgi:hypothetical protein